MDKYTACEVAYKNGYNKTLEEFSDLIKDNSIRILQSYCSYDVICCLLDNINKLSKEMKKE